MDIMNRAFYALVCLTQDPLLIGRVTTDVKVPKKSVGTFITQDSLL